jgi:hypothetical protein
MIASRTPLRLEEAGPMNPPKCDDLDSIHFLIAAQKVFTGTEAARCVPEGEEAPAHDAFTYIKIFNKQNIMIENVEIMRKTRANIAMKKLIIRI